LSCLVYFWEIKLIVAHAIISYTNRRYE